MAVGLNLAQVVGASFPIEASEISIINDHATNPVIVTTGLPTGTSPAGVTYGSISLPAGQALSWGNIPSGMQTITIDATTSSAQVAWS